MDEKVSALSLLKKRAERDGAAMGDDQKEDYMAYDLGRCDRVRVGSGSGMEVDLGGGRGGWGLTCKPAVGGRAESDDLPPNPRVKTKSMVFRPPIYLGRPPPKEWLSR